MTLAASLITVGIIITLLGIAGVFYCILLARRVQKGQVAEDDLQSILIRMSAINMAAVGGAFMGLAILLVGLIL